MRRRRVQVGWYCDHEHEPFGEGTHLSFSSRWRRGKWQDTYPEPSTRTAMTFLDHKEPTKRPQCPLAEPIYVYRSPEAVAS